MDLHDELGSQLGSIGLTADVAADMADEVRRRELLGQIAETAAAMGTSLADIVWSLRRGELKLEQLARHLAAHGRRLFPAESPVLDIRFPGQWPEVPLSPAAGRAVLLIGVEGLHNAARHSGAGRVTLALEPEGRRWRLSIGDDGCGIAEPELSGTGGGFGLETIRRRADTIGALLDVESASGGTWIRLTFDSRATDRRLGGGMALPWIRMRFTRQSAAGQTVTC
jgi:signal transduction histidine kinase